jgi:hypothetical protein
MFAEVKENAPPERGPRAVVPIMDGCRKHPLAAGAKLVEATEWN